MGIHIGLALYSLREQLEKDFFGTLEQVAKVGYTHVELIGHSISDSLKETVTPKAIKAKLDELGLTPISSHVGLTPDSNWDEIIENHLIMGCQGIVVPFGFLGTEEEVTNTANMCNTIGKKCRDNGLNFYYHNHFQEFIKVDGVYGLQLLAQRTDPSYLSFELDAFWAQRGGVNPIDAMDFLGDRLKIVHQKDMSKDTSPINLYEILDGPVNMEVLMNAFQSGQGFKPTDIVEVGTGIMDVKAICEKAKQMPSVECIIVELDTIYNMPPIESVTVSYNNLKKFVG